MNRLISRLWLLLIPVLILSACGIKDDPFRYMPADSNMVMSINLGQISEKMNFNAIRDETGLGMLSMILSAQGIPNFIADRTVTGINFEAPSYVCSFPLEDGANQVAIIFEIEDEEKLETFLTKIDEGFKPEKSGGVTSGTMAIGEIGWKGKFGIATLSLDMMMEVETKSVGDLFELKKSESFASGEQGEKMLADSKDMQLWVNLSSMEKKSGEGGIDLGDNLALEGSVDFLNGESLLELNVMGDEATMEEWATLFADRNPSGLAQYLPKSGEQPAVLGVSMNPPAFFAWLEDTGIMENMMEGRDQDEQALVRLVMSQMSEALNGDVLIAMTDFPDMGAAMEAIEDTMYQPPTTSFCIGLGIADAEALNRFIQLQVSDSVMIQVDDQTYRMVDGQEDMHLVTTAGAAYLTNDNALVEKVRTGMGNTELDPETTGRMGEYVIYGRMDLQGFFATIASMQPTEGAEIMNMATDMAKAMGSTIEYVEWKASSPTKEGWKHVFRAQMAEDTPNSLELMMRQLLEGVMKGGAFGIL